MSDSIDEPTVLAITKTTYMNLAGEIETLACIYVGQSSKVVAKMKTMTTKFDQHIVLLPTICPWKKIFPIVKSLFKNQFKLRMEKINREAKIAAELGFEKMEKLTLATIPIKIGKRSIIFQENPVFTFDDIIKLYEDAFGELVGCSKDTNAIAALGL